MAFGEKQRKINELEGQVQCLQGELATLEPWVGLAKTIRDTTTQYAAEMDIDTAVSLAVSGAAEEQRKAFVTAAFNQLDPERQLEVLVSTFSDGVLREALEAERQRRLSLTEKDLALDRIVREAREYRRFKISEAPADARVELFLYEPGELDKNGTDTTLDPDPRTYGGWTRNIKGIVTNDGKIEVHSDQISNLVRYSPIGKYIFADHQIMAPLVPHKPGDDQPLYYGTSVTIPKPRESTWYGSTTLDLGPVYINDIDIFGVTTAATE